MKSSIIILLLILSHQIQAQEVATPIKIKWTKNIKGDFSFTSNWSYPEGVGLKPDGKAGCVDGGHCPNECYTMMDSNGVVFPDSAKRFYELLDTSHLFHTLSCDAWCYEWAGSDYLYAERKKDKSVHCFSATGIATHCSLELVLKNDTCWATIGLISIRLNGDATFYAKDGFIQIDKKAWKKGQLKAAFYFNFAHPQKPEHRIYWGGLVDTPVK